MCVCLCVCMCVCVCVHVSVCALKLINAVAFKPSKYGMYYH